MPKIKTTPTKSISKPAKTPIKLKPVKWEKVQDDIEDISSDDTEELHEEDILQKEQDELEEMYFVLVHSNERLSNENMDLKQDIRDLNAFIKVQNDSINGYKKDIGLFSQEVEDYKKKLSHALDELIEAQKNLK